jgi:DHA1 family tetracycline resistance protein-like MFS transporter
VKDNGMDKASPRQAGVGFIFVTLVLAVIGFGLLIPVLPKLVVELNGGEIASGSHTYGVIIGCYALMQFIFSPILGSLSDRFGRRKIILIATAGSACDYFIMAYAPTLAWFFLARIIAGATAGVLSTANAYIADVTPPEKRAQSFGLLGAAFGIGFIIGPVVGGLLGSKEVWMSQFITTHLSPQLAHWLADHSLRLPFFVAGTCATVNWLYGYFALPESLKPENRREFSWGRANPIGALYALKRLPAVLGLAECYFIMMLAQTMLQTTWALYTGHRYNWGPLAIGLSLMAVGVLTGLVQATLIKRLVPKLGETKAVLTGFCISILAQVGYGLATHGWMIYAIMFMGAFAGISGPALQAYITKHVPANEQGAVQGVYGGLASLAGIPGPLLGSWSFGWAVAADRPEWLAGAPFFLGAIITGIALLLAVRTFRKDAAAHAAPVATAP